MRHHIYGSAKCSTQCDAKRKLIERHAKSDTNSDANANSGSTMGLSCIRILVRLCRHLQTPIRMH
jgi:hypothetical protein